MKIVLYVNSFLPLIGGREIVVHYLAKALKELGHDVRVVGAPGWWKNRNLRLGYPVHRYPQLRGFFPQQVKFLQLLFDVFFYRADVINAHATFPTGYLASKLKSLINIPLIITPHGEDIQKIPEIDFGDRLDPGVNKKIEFAIKKADKIIAISDTIKNAAIEVTGSREKVASIANGIDNVRFEKRVEVDVYSWLGLPADSEIILTVGNYHPRKGHEVIIRAMPDLLESHPKARLVIVGPKTEALKPLIAELKLTDKVVLTGRLKFPFPALLEESSEDPVSSNETDWLAAIYQNSALYVSAGINEGAEGLSLALLDGMAAGLPVVATNISGNRDVVVDGENGILVQPGNEKELAEAIGGLIGNPVLHEKMCKHAIETSKKFFWSKIAKEYVSVYVEACKNTRKDITSRDKVKNN